MTTLTRHPTATFATGFAILALAAAGVLAVGPSLGALLTPNGAQAVIFALILAAIISAVSLPFTALS